MEDDCDGEDDRNHMDGDDVPLLPLHLPRPLAAHQEHDKDDGNPGPQTDVEKKPRLKLHMPYLLKTRRNRKIIFDKGEDDHEDREDVPVLQDPLPCVVDVHREDDSDGEDLDIQRDGEDVPLMQLSMLHQAEVHMEPDWEDENMGIHMDGEKNASDQTTKSWRWSHG